MTVQKCDEMVSQEDKSMPVPADQSTHAGFSELVALAKQAFEEKRRKSCLALTNAILKIDSQNKDARDIQALVQADLQEDIKRAYAYMRDARTRADLTAYQEARQLLDNVLDVDPSIEDAKILLSRLGLVLREGTAVSSGSSVAADMPRNPTASPDSAAEAAKRVASTRPPNYLPKTAPPEVPEQRHRRLFSGILIASMVWLGFAIAIVLAWQLEWREQSRVVSTATGNANPSANSTGAHEIVTDQGPGPLNSQDTATAPIASTPANPGDVLGPLAGQERVVFAKEEVATNFTTTLPGRIELLVLPANAQMQIDGGPAESLPPYLDIQAGKHQLTFTASGFESQTVSVLVPAGGRRNVAAVLVPTMAPVLKLDSKPTS